MFHTYVADWLGMPQVRMGGARMTHSPLLPRARVTPLSAYALCRHALVRDRITQHKATSSSPPPVASLHYHHFHTYVLQLRTKVEFGLLEWTDQIMDKRERTDADGPLIHQICSYCTFFDFELFS